MVLCITMGEKGETYELYLGKDQSNHVQDSDDGAAGDQGHGRLDVELLGPEGEEGSR